MRFPLLALPGLAALLVCAQGCATGNAKVASTAPRQGAGAMSPDEQLDESRLADATNGLKFNGGLVTVANPTAADPAKAESIRKQAEAKMAERNVWFESIGAFRDAILADPSNAKSYEGLSRAFLMEGKTDYAEQALATAVKLSPTFSAARYRLGLVHQMDSDYAGAVKEWKTLVRTDPGYQDVYARMAIASYYSQNYSAAYRYLAEADRRHQDVPPQFRGLLKEAAPRP